MSNGVSRSDFERLVDRLSPHIDQALKRFAWPGADSPARLIQAMDYSLWAGGKRLRPMLAICACEAVGGNAQDAFPVAAAFEMIHTYSLIHDDLPAMDDDDLRRGKPTCHKAFDEATAILAGDGMLTFAFELLSSQPGDAARWLAVVRELARGAGVEGMVGGQQADLEGEGTKPTLEQLRYIHARKTGALITAACVCGGIVGGATAPQIEQLRRYGRDVGMAFQVVDDILDITSTAEQLGKSPGKDAKANKITYPVVMGMEGAKSHARELVSRAESALAGLAKPEDLRAVARYFVERTY